MPKARINCPNCRQPVIADIETLLDVGVDSTVKQRVLTGAINVIACQSCGYQGSVATPLVYHDPEKELLLTYFPAEMGLPVNEQERIIGPLITKLTSSLPPEKRKAYLFRPQTMFTMQTMVERILEGDGITKEMIQAQQHRMDLLQRLLSSSDDQIVEITTTEDAQFDGDFFNLLARLIETAHAAGDQASLKTLTDLHKKLLPLTSAGRVIQEQGREIEEALQSLRQVGKELTREKALDLVLKAPSDIQLGIIVSYTRVAMDYTFFQLLSQQIEQATGTEKERLLDLRRKILELTQEIDQQIEANLNQARALLNTLLQAPNIQEATLSNLQAIDEFFVRAFNEARETARKNADLDMLARLRQIEEVLNKASAPPKEIALIEDLLDASDEKSMREKLKQHQSEITPEFMEILSTLVARLEDGENAELRDRIKMLYRMALQASMRASI